MIDDVPKLLSMMLKMLLTMVVPLTISSNSEKVARGGLRRQFWIHYSLFIEYATTSMDALGIRFIFLFIFQSIIYFFFFFCFSKNR